MQLEIPSSVALPDALLRFPRSVVLAHHPEVPLQDLRPRRPRQREHRQARSLETRRPGGLSVPVLQKGKIIFEIIFSTIFYRG